MIDFFACEIVLFFSFSNSSLQPTREDVLHQDLDVLVPVGAASLVVEAWGVEQLVLDRPVVNAALTAQRHGLAITLTTQGTASAGMLGLYG